MLACNGVIDAVCLRVWALLMLYFACIVVIALVTGVYYYVYNNWLFCAGFC